MQRFTAAERRARLGRRHALAPSCRADGPVDAARAVVALHGTDPASTFLSACARTSAPDLAAVERALYVDRTLVRVLAMRRTVFAAPRDTAVLCLAGAADTVAREQRRLLHKFLLASDVTSEPEEFVVAAEGAAVAAMTGREVTSADLVAAHGHLATRVRVGAQADAAEVSVASRLLTMLSAHGTVVRTRPRGGWTSTQFRWALMHEWADLGPLPGPDEAAAGLARAWLERFGPATADDLQWWAGWTKTRTCAALAAVGAVEVDLDGVDGLALPDDLDHVPAPEPWVALLPALDPTTMGWKRRDVFLGPHRARLFDVNGNAGPTIWCDGRVVGGWAHRDDGEVAVRLLEDVGADATAAVEAEAARLADLLGDVRLKARARGWTPLERELRA